jgi:FkbM family methyltransferase
LCWDKLEEHPNPCELFSERKVWNPDPHVREALVSALLPCTLSPGECNYLDGGGNMGVFSLWAWALGAKVVMVEPQVDLVKAMARTIRLNCAGDDIQVLHAGVTGKALVGDKARGPLVAGGTLAVNNVWGTYSFRQCQPPQGAKFHTYNEAEVPAILIDDILLDRPKWDLIKLDVDGFDLDLLDRILGLVERQEVEVVSCIIECNDARHAQYAELIVKAHALGYTVYKLNVHDNRRAFNEDGWDFVSVRSFIAAFDLNPACSLLPSLCFLSSIFSTLFPPTYPLNQNYQPIKVEPYLKEVYHRRSMKYAFEVIKGLPTHVYLDMLSVEIPELLFTLEDWVEPVHFNTEKVPFKPFGG